MASKSDNTPLVESAYGISASVYDPNENKYQVEALGIKWFLDVHEGNAELLNGENRIFNIPVNKAVALYIEQHFELKDVLKTVVIPRK